MEIIAHRGCSKKHGDNTMNAFKLASELNCGIELDCQITKDKVIICTHNPFCKETGIMTYDINYDENIHVKLHDVFVEVGNNVEYFFIDIKDTRLESDVVFYLINLVIIHKIQNKCIFASFNEFHLRDICDEERRRTLFLKKAYITGNMEVDMFASKIKTWGLSYIIIYKFQINKTLVSFLKSQNVKLFVYTCNTIGTFHYCEECKCDGIISDIPEFFKDLSK